MAQLRKKRIIWDGKCKICGKSIPDVRFQKESYLQKNGKTKSYIRHVCFSCDIPRRIKGNSLARYGITLSDYELLKEKQGHRCAVCGKHESELNGNHSTSATALYVDHCHTTNRVRGLLCGRCNLAIGNFYDNPLFLHNAIKYLERS